MEAARTDLSRVSISVQVNKNTISLEERTHNCNQLVQHLRQKPSGQWVQQTGGWDEFSQVFPLRTPAGLSARLGARYQLLGKLWRTTITT